MTYKEALDFVEQRISLLYPQDERPTIAHWIVSWVTHKSDAQLVARPYSELTAKEHKQLNQLLLDHVEHHKPLQYIFGTVSFLDLCIITRPPVLIPRPETEYMCSYMIEQLRKVDNQKLRILDMCTGSGCIALAFADAFKQADVYAVDISAQACDLASENAQKNKLALMVIESDLFQNVPTQQTFDIIISNPPYISTDEWAALDPSVKEWEDKQALLAKDNGLEIIEKIINQADERLGFNKEMYDKHIPQLVIEIDYNQGTLVPTLFKKAGFTNIIVHKDLSGNNRFVTALPTWKKTFKS